MKLLNIVLVLALAVSVQSNEVKNLRGENVTPKNEEPPVPVPLEDPSTEAKKEGPSAGAPEKVDATQESTEVGAVQLDATEGGESKGVDEPSAGRKCERWVTCRNGWYGGVRCSSGRYCTMWVLPEP